MDRSFVIAFILFIISFIFVTRDVWRRNSRLALFRISKTDKIKQIEAENDERLRWADAWMRTRLASGHDSTLWNPSSSLPLSSSSSSSSLDIVIITTPRPGKFRTLTQTATRFAELAQRQRFFKARVVLCDVSKAKDERSSSSTTSSSSSSSFPTPSASSSTSLLDNSELTLLTKQFGFPVVKPPKNVTKMNIFEKEKQDYLYCLNATAGGYAGGVFNNNNIPSSSSPPSDAVLVVEDDAYPEPDIFGVLDDVVHSRSRRVAEFRSALFFKLYHPERLLGYLNPEPTRILEWILFSAVAASFLRCALGVVVSSVIFRRRRAKVHVYQWFFCFLFAMSAFELLDRNAVLQWRRLDPRLYAVVPAPNCCTQLLLFPRRQIPGVVSALSAVSCRSGFAKDAALDDIKRRHRIGAFLIEPNLVKHIGFYSTLRKAATVNPFSV